MSVTLSDGNQRGEIDMDNEQIIRKAYQMAEDVNIPGWVAGERATTPE